MRNTILIALTAGLMAPLSALAQGGGDPGMMFEMLDADGDGKITAAEMEAHRTGRVAGLDADGDGLISQAEMVAHAMVNMQKRAEVMAARRIEAQDADGDGMLSAAEMMVPPMQGKMLDRLDADGDGAISLEEFEAAKAKGKKRHGGKGHGEKRKEGGHSWWR